MKKQQTKEKPKTTTIKKGELVVIRAKGRTFHAKAAASFNPFHSMIYPVVDLDRGGVSIALSYQEVESVSRDNIQHD
jgi:hypothetical protein